MDITIRNVNEITVADFGGNLDTNTSSEAESKLSELVNQGVHKILINLEKLEYTSSVGLRVLLAAAKQLKSNGGELRICSPNEMVQEVFDISGFSTILKVFSTESEALSGF